MDAGEKWNRRYQQADVEERPSCLALVEYAHLLPASGRGLDLACGLGGNATFLARRGLETLATDISTVAIEKIAAYAKLHQLPLSAEAMDLERGHFPAGQFDVIVVSHYLYRPLMEKLATALQPGGLLFYQTFSLENPDDIGPANTAFRLQPNELLQRFDGLRVIAYREDGLYGDLKQGLRGQAYFIGARPL